MSDRSQHPQVIGLFDFLAAQHARLTGCHAFEEDGGCNRGHRISGEWRRLPCACREEIAADKHFREWEEAMVRAWTAQCRAEGVMQDGDQ